MAKWRQTQLLQNDKDFAFAYVSFEEAYLDADREVAMAWTRCMQKSVPVSHTDAAHLLPFTATSAKIKACNEIKKMIKGTCNQQSKDKMSSNSLRHPGQGTQNLKMTWIMQGSSSR